MNQSAYYPLCASEGLQVEQTATEVIVFDSRKQQFHFLNSTAYDIFKACNGRNRINDIAGLLARKFNTDDSDSLVSDVTDTIGSFQEKGLMMFVAHESQQEQAPSVATDESPLFAVSVTGTSMFPILLSGDRVLVKRTSFDELQTGDIVIWSDEFRNRVAHRIVSLEKSATPPLVITKGDLRVEADAPVEFDRVIGKIVAVWREGEVRWMTELDGKNPSVNGDKKQDEQQVTAAARGQRRPSYQKMKVLDLRDISVESIRNIESVEDISLVLLAPENSHAWAEVPARDVKTVFTAPKDYRIYTGQPELLPEMLEFLEAPLRVIVSGQLFVTEFEPQQLAQAFKELILIGQAYVSSAEAKAVLESLTNIISGGIKVVPREHIRWIGESVLGPEYLSSSVVRPLVAIGDLAISKRLGEDQNGISVFK